MNVVTLIGNLATEVEARDVGEEKKVASFVLAVDRRSSTGGADFIRISAWDKQAESCERFLTKGQRVAVDGRLRSRSWDDPDGKKRSAVEVVANHVQFLSLPERAESPFEEAAVS